MVGFAAICVYCCFCLLYMLWITIEAVSVYAAEPVIDGYITSIIHRFLYNSMQAVSYTHLRAPRDRQKSRMPSSA